MNKMRLLYHIRLSLTALLALACTSLYAQKTIYVLSDLHVMAPELLINKGSAWDAYMENERKMVDKSKEVFDALSEQIKAARPDLVLISGDMTKDGEILSHQYVTAQLREWQSEGIATLVVPGDHDFGTSTSNYYDGATTTQAEVLDSEGYKEMYAGIGYFDHDDAAQAGFTTFSYWQEPIEGLIVVGLDSHTGSVDPSDVEEACRRIKWARHDGYEVIVMMHHELQPHFYQEESLMGVTLVTNWEEVKEKLLAAGAHIVFTGHVHVADIARDYNADMSASIVDVNNGCPISYPCDYRVVTFDPTTKDIHIGTESVTAIEGIDNFSSYAKERLTTSTKQMASDLITQAVNEYAPSYAPFLFLYLDRWSTALTNALILHAEGNEGSANANLKNSIYSDLSLPLSLVPEGRDILNSILEDKAPYDPEGLDPHMNVTDDRDLTIAHDYVTVEMKVPGMAELQRRLPEIPSAATLYYGDTSLLTPDGVSVYTMALNGSDGQETLQKSKTYTADEVIPSGTAVIVQHLLNVSDYMDDSSMEFDAILSQLRTLAVPSPTKCTFRKTDAYGTPDAANVLQGSDVAALTTGPDAGVTYKYYKLCWQKNGGSDVERLGFFVQETDGSAFVSEAHEAYLSVPADMAAESYTFDDLTGIRTLANKQEGRTDVYTLSGVKMQSDRLPKGIYIVNGKKIIR